MVAGRNLDATTTIMSTLPIIDITPWTCTTTRGTAAQKLTSEALHNACLKYGFFYLKLDGWLDPAQPDELLALGRTFFHQDQSEKDRIGLKNQDGARGLSATYKYAWMFLVRQHPNPRVSTAARERDHGQGGQS